MIVTDAAAAAVARPAHAPLRALFSLFGLSTLTAGEPRHVPGGVAAPSDWQQARAAAHRAVSAARSGDLRAASAYFTAAFSLDRDLQPGQIADFWQLTISAFETAERALRAAGRYDDAATLAGEVAFRFGNHPDCQPARAAS